MPPPASHNIKIIKMNLPFPRLSPTSETTVNLLACRRQGAFLGNRAPAVRSPRPRTARAVAGAEIRAAAPPATSVPRCPQAPGTCQSAPPGGGAHCGCTRPRELSAAAAADPGVWRSETPVRVSGSVGMATQPEMRQEKSRGAVASRASSPLSGCRSHRRRAGRRAGGRARSPHSPPRRGE